MIGVRFFCCTKISKYEPKKHQLLEALLFVFNSGKLAAEACYMFVETYDVASISGRVCCEWFKRFKKEQRKKRSQYEKRHDEVTVLNNNVCPYIATIVKTYLTHINKRSCPTFYILQIWYHLIIAYSNRWCITWLNSTFLQRGQKLDRFLDRFKMWAIICCKKNEKKAVMGIIW